MKKAHKASTERPKRLSVAEYQCLLADALYSEGVRLQKGDEVLTVGGEVATVATEYGAYRVHDDEGPYINSEGRFRIAVGYVVSFDDGSRVFYAPGDLFTRAGKPTHLRMIVNNR